MLQFKKLDFSQREMIYKFYLSNTKYINNWDLVDLSAPYIVGEFLKEVNKAKIYELAKSDSLWEKRIAVVSTIIFIKNNDFVDIIKLSEILMKDKAHDLIQKAMGWMLREVGKINNDVLLQFLDKYSKTMPRTMLRYSIEKLTLEQRKYYMQ